MSDIAPSAQDPHTVTPSVNSLPEQPLSSSTLNNTPYDTSAIVPHSDITTNTPSTTTTRSLHTEHQIEQPGSLQVIDASKPQMAEVSPQPLIASQPAIDAIKDDASDSSSVAAPMQSYGTRSSNRSRPRPNYADDDDNYDFMKPVTVSSKRSTPAANNPQWHAVNGTDDNAVVSSKSTKVKTGDAATTNGVSTDTKPKDAPPEKKKRKYEKASAAKAAAGEPRQVASDTLPGTSQFLAADSATSDAPPSKKRKTGDHVAVATQAATSAGVVSGHRKGSGGHVRSGPRPSCIVTFEKTGAILQDGKLVADDGTTFAVDGESIQPSRLQAY